MVAASQVGRVMKLALLLATCALGPQIHAESYYVVIAGLGGEPDYEQRFTQAAKDLDRIFKAAGRGAHVYTLTGAQATATKFAETMDEVARDAKPQDDFILTLI